jgi:hypothetical protein
LREINSTLGEKNEKKLKKKWEKRKAMEAEVMSLTKELDLLNNTRNNLFSSITNDERLLAE